MSMNEETLSRMQHIRLLGMHAAFKASQENFTLDKGPTMSLPHGLLPMSGMIDATELSKGLSRLQALDMKLPWSI